MPQGMQDLIGYGSAQVLRNVDTSIPEIVKARQEGDDVGYQRQQFSQREKERKEKELYGILGDQFNPRNFNLAIQDQLRKAKTDLAAKLKGSNMSYGDVYMEAQQKAGELAQVSDKLNKLDSQLAATRSEYEKFDKRLNTPAIEYEARKKIYDAIRNGQPIDESRNYFDEALTSMTDNALTDKTDITFHNFTPDEEQNLSGKSRERNSVGRVNEFDWKVKNYPSLFDFKEGKEFESPTISTKSEPSGIKDQKGNELPMLSQDAYNRFVMLPSNRKALDIRIKNKYGNIDLNSKKADTYRKIEAYNDVEKIKPAINKARIEMQPIPKVSINVNGSTKNAGGDWVKRATAAAQTKDVKNIEDEFAQLFQGDKNLYQKVEMDGNNLKITYKTPQKNDLLGQIIPEQPKVVTLDINDEYLPQKLANVYQTIMGGDVNVERQQYGNTKKPANRSADRPPLESFIKK